MKQEAVLVTRYAGQGRFDFSYDGKNPAKLLEYNADTPTALYEASYFQWIWLEDLIKGGLLSKDIDQFNSIQEKLIDFFTEFNKDEIYFSSIKNTEEDKATVEYIVDCAIQAGVKSKFIFIEDIGLRNDQFVDIGLKEGQFVDLTNKPIKTLFKLYPWEYIWEDEFSDAVMKSSTTYLEPPWKMILSNKGMLPLLWERHKNHPNLLPSFFAKDHSNEHKNFIGKPFFSREGEGVLLNKVPSSKESLYITQEFYPLPHIDGNYPVLGLWIVNNKSCGLGIREDETLITKDTSRFIPHIIKD